MSFRPLALLDKAIRAVCAALMGAMTLAVILSVFFRYVLSMTTAWSEELITMLFVATSMLGTAMVARADEHISIDFLPMSLPPRARAALKAAISLAVIAVMAVVLKASFRWIAVNGQLKTPGLELPYRWFYSLLPLSAGLVMIFELGKVAVHLKAAFSKAGSASEGARP